MNLASSFVAVLLLAGCVGVDDQDGRDDTFPSGKADGAIEEGSWRALSALRVANTVSLDDLSRSIDDDGVGLTRTAARGILAFRSGADGVLGTSDDRQLTALWQLDAVPYVGPVSLQRLVDYAVKHGLVTSNQFRCEPVTPSPDSPTYTGTWQDATADWELQLTAHHGDWDSWVDCAASYTQSTPGVTRYGCYFEPEWTFFEPTFAIKLPADVRTRSTVDATVVDITSDRRYNDGFREIAGTEQAYTCTSVAPID